jgi:hypothetical protein
VYLHLVEEALLTFEAKGWGGRIGEGKAPGTAGGDSGRRRQPQSECEATVFARALKELVEFLTSADCLSI